MRTLLKLICLITTLLASQAAMAWGNEGHLLVCGLAEQYLSPKGKAFVTKTLAMGEYLDGDSKDDLASACLWPDKAKYADYKGTYEQHYLNVPRDAKSIDLARDCAALDCIAVGVQRSLTYLSRPAQGEREKARKAAALRFLGHYIADLHQPLHVSNAEDWGGNKIKVKWFGDDTNLHAVWDSGIIEHAGMKYPGSVSRLVGLNPAVGSTNVLEWMRESFRLARTYAYPGMDGKPIKSGDVIGKDYYLRSLPIVKNQLAKAGIRLAWLINQLAEGKLDTNILIQ